MLGFNPYFAIAGGIALIAAAGGGFVKGEQIANAQRDQAALHQLVDALNDRDAKQKQIDTLERTAAERETARQTEVRNIYVDVPKIVSRPVYRNECIDADGVRLLDRAQSAAAGPPGAGPGAPAGQAGPGAERPPKH